MFVIRVNTQTNVNNILDHITGQCRICQTLSEMHNELAAFDSLTAVKSFEVSVAEEETMVPRVARLLSKMSFNLYHLNIGNLIRNSL